MNLAAQAQAWLPDAAILGARPRAAIEAAATQWAARWMTGRGVKVAGWRLDDRGPSAQADRVVRPGVSVEMRSGARARLLTWALALDDADPAASPNDQRVLTAFADRMVADLATALAALSARPPAPEPTEEGAVLIADLASDNGAPLARLVLARSWAVNLAKALAPPPARPSALSLTPRLRAAAKADCAIEAVLGRVRLGLGDLKALAPGDVLVLDTPLDGRVQLRAQASGRPLGLGRHDHHGDDRVVIL